jgi:dienelactone hydrolase
MLLCTGLAAQGTLQADSVIEGLPQTLPVAETFDNRPFDYTIHSGSEKDYFTVYRITYPSPLVTSVPQNNTVPAEYYLPRGIRPDDPKRPAAICLHILNGDYELVHLTCSMLAARGIPAIMFKLPYYAERSVPGGHDHVAATPDLFVSALSQAVLDVRRTYDMLASRPEVDPERIGVLGISLGGILGATSAGVDERIARAALILTGGDLRHMIRHAREARELSEQIDRFPAEQRSKIWQAIDSVDPLTHAAALKQRAMAGKVLMINAAEDDVVPRRCTDKLASALDITDRVVWLEGLGHYTSMAELPQIMRTTVAFFAEDLPAGLQISQPPVTARTAEGVVALFLQQVAAMLTKEPQEGYCHFADVEFSVTPEGEKTIEGRVRFIRGSGYKFRLFCKIPGLAEATLCQGQYPWMASGDKIVFKGTAQSAAKPDDPFGFADSDYVVKLRAVAGAAAGVALAPGILEQWITISDTGAGHGPRSIQITLKEKQEGTVDVELREDGKTPHRVRFDVAGVKGSATFHGWQTDTVAHRALFEPPAELPEKEVEPAALVRVFSAMFNFAMESTQ